MNMLLDRLENLAKFLAAYELMGQTAWDFVLQLHSI